MIAYIPEDGTTITLIITGIKSKNITPELRGLGVKVSGLL
jgi:hypothetical protein